MIIVGTSVANGKMKVDGCFIDESQVVTIEAVTPPNPPENQIGKDTVMFLDTIANELIWEYVDRPLTDAETILRQQEQIALMQQALDELLLGGM